MARLTNEEIRRMSLDEADAYTDAHPAEAWRFAKAHYSSANKQTGKALKYGLRTNTKPPLTATNGQGRFLFRLNTISPQVQSPKGFLLHQEQTCDCSPGLSHGQRLWYADIPDLFCSSRFSSKFPRCRRINIRFLAW